MTPSSERSGLDEGARAAPKTAVGSESRAARRASHASTSGARSAARLGTEPALGAKARRVPLAGSLAHRPLSSPLPAGWRGWAGSYLPKPSLLRLGAPASRPTAFIRVRGAMSLSSRKAAWKSRHASSRLDADGLATARWMCARLASPHSKQRTARRSTSIKPSGCT